jgi:hypothetical protein
MRLAVRVLFWLVFVLLVLALACSGSVPSPPPFPAEPAKTRTAPAPPLPDPCQAAAELRRLVPALLDKGRLDRTVRIIDKANRLCSKAAAETWAAQVETLCGAWALRRSARDGAADRGRGRGAGGR